MPDEKKDDVVDQGAKPVVDEAKVAELVAAKLKDQLGTYVRTQDDPPPVVKDPPPVDPVRELVHATVGEELRGAHFSAQNAADLAKFYNTGSGDEREERLEAQAEIEQTFDKLAKAGRPWSREDIWNWLKGKKEPERQEKARTRAEAKRKAAEDAASLAGPGGTKPVGRSNKDPHTMNDDELNTAVQGVEF